MTVTILGKRWTLKFVPKPPRFKGEDCDGICDHGRRTIRIYKKQSDGDTLETLIHECLHAADEFKNEYWVSEVARDLAIVLCKLGYRKADP